MRNYKQVDTEEAEERDGLLVNIFAVIFAISEVTLFIWSVV